MSLTTKKWTVAKQFEGVPREDDFKLVEEPVSLSLKPGEILVEAVYLTVDPYMRGVLGASKIGATMGGEQVGRVKVSNNPTYPEGTLVQGHFGWQTMSLISNTEGPGLYGTTVRKLPDMGDLSPSLALGCLGMPGLSAYFGLLDRGQPTEGEVVLVNAASGAVGSMVAQIARIKGCTVIASAGSKAKCDWIKGLGFDHVFNYKETSVDDALKEFAPNGIDLYFDNVGGDFSYTVLKNHMKTKGRVVVCGAISQYNDIEQKERSTYGIIIYKQLDVLGFLVSLYTSRFSEGLENLMQWVKEGKVKYQETVTQGFEHMPQAFISLFSGANFGKAIVKV